ncbi:MAG: hypothetical protein J6I50_06060 [Clostridia bacterium]|nr:hypothetical protein [Clostridia bacterium]
MKLNREKLIEIAKKVLYCISNPRLLLCFGIAWMITNGWSYVMMGIGTFFGIQWMMAVSGAYLAFLWLPISPEKIVTLAIAIFLLKKLFPHDTKTLGLLHELHMKTKALYQKEKEKKKQRRGKAHTKNEDKDADSNEEMGVSDSLEENEQGQQQVQSQKHTDV